MFLGENLLVWLVLAIGGAMATGNIAALIRPPIERRNDEDLERAPLIRSIVFSALGMVAAVWAVGSLIDS